MLTSRSLSVVIACYRDAGSVRECYRRLTEVLSEVTDDYEIIYVNDASPDDAEAILRELADSDARVVVVNHTRNFGSQNAFLSGMAVSRGDGVVLMDGDLQDPPEIIPGLVAKWLEGYPIVYGIRTRRMESAFRNAAYRLFYRLFRAMARFDVPVDAGDFGLMDRAVVKMLLESFPERLTFLRGLRAYTGFRQTGVEYVRQPRFDGVSTNNLASNIRWALLGIFSFSDKPLEYIGRLALLAVLLTGFAISVYLGAYVLSLAGVLDKPPPGYMTLLLAVLCMGSVQLVCFSIIAEYLRHMYEEVKGRPRYIVRDVIDNRPPPAAEDADDREGA